MKLHQLVDTSQAVESIINNPQFAIDTQNTVDGIWVRDVPGDPAVGDAATGFDPVAVNTAFHSAMPLIPELGVAVFGAGYWSKPTLLRAIWTMRNLCGEKVNIGIGTGYDVNLLSLCGTAAEHKQSKMQDILEELQTSRSASPSRATYWVATTRPENWCNYESIGGILLPAMPTERLATIIKQRELLPPRIGMLLKVAPAIGSTKNATLTVETDSRGIVLNTGHVAAANLINGLNQVGVTDIILNVERASAADALDFISNIKSAIRN